MIDASAPSTVVKRQLRGNSATANQDGRVRVALCCEASGLLFILMCEEFPKSPRGEGGILETATGVEGHVGFWR